MAKEVNNTQNYDPEVEKEAIAAEESYKNANGHYRESSAYNKAQNEKKVGTESNPVGESNQYDPEVEKAAIAAEESYKKANGKYRESSAYNKAKKAVRKDLNGKVIGEYKM